MRTCGTCGRQNQPGAQFCAGCGDYLGWTDDEPEAAAPTPPPAEPEEAEEPPPPAGKPVVPTKPAAPPRRAGTRDGGRPIPSWAQPVGDRADRRPEPAPGPDTGGQQDREPRHRRPAVPERAEKPAPTAEPPAPGAPPAPAGRAAPVAPATPAARPARPDRPDRPARKEARKAATAPFEPPRLRSVGHAARALDEGRRVAEQQGRPDLGAHLAAAGERLAARLFPVAVVGEFKRGKSTLVNALLQTDVCPVDADIVTAVPTLVRYGEEATAIALLQAPGDAGRPDGEPVAEPVDVDRLMDLVGETRGPGVAAPAPVRRGAAAAPAAAHRPRARRHPRRRRPGVRARQRHARRPGPHAARWSSSPTPSQELTAPGGRLPALRRSTRCPTGVCVVTKTDLYPQWRRIVDLDRRHLAAAGIDMPVVPVSSFLRLRAWREPELNEESGFAPLFDWLRTQVVEAAARGAGRRRGDATSASSGAAAGGGGGGAAGHRAGPEEGERVVAQLRDRHERTRRLVADRRRLEAGARRTASRTSFADVEHDLSERLRVLTREAEAVIDQGDPKETWPDVEVWLQRRLVSAATANYDLLSERAEELAAEVAEQFRLESEVPLDLGLTAPADVLRGLAVDPGDDAAARPAPGAHGVRRPDGGADPVRRVRRHGRRQPAAASRRSARSRSCSAPGSAASCCATSGSGSSPTGASRRRSPAAATSTRPPSSSARTARTRSAAPGASCATSSRPARPC